MDKLERIATTAQFANHLAALEEIAPAPELPFRPAYFNAEQLNNQSTAANPHNASYVLGWGSSEQSLGFGGFNSGYSNASIRFTTKPGSNALAWYAVPKS